MTHSLGEDTMLHRMLSGDRYLASEPELTQMRDRAQQLLHQINNSPPNSSAQQTLIKTLFGNIGSNSEIRPNFRCDYGSNIYAGDNLYIKLYRK